jgi:hypothetical protein
MADVKVRVTLDTQGARKDAQSLARDLGKTLGTQGSKGGGFGFSAAMGATAGFARFLYGNLLSQGAQEIQGAGNLIGRASPAGQEMASFYGKMGARRNATEQTQDFFGMTGEKASDKQILSIYEHFKMMNQMDVDGRTHTGTVVVQNRVANESASVISDLKFAASHLEEVTRALYDILSGGKR